MTKITILGRVPSKKNSKVMICRGVRPMLIPSKKHKEWHDDAMKQLSFVKLVDKTDDVEFIYYAPDKRKGDLSNKWESVADVLVDAGIIEDDNWFILPRVDMVFGGVDRENPRAEVLFK